MSDAFGWGVLWTRPLWTDEISLKLLVEHGSLGRMLSDLAQGGDWAPPLLHVVLWCVTRVAGPLTPVLLRSLSLLCVAGAIGFLVLTLRRSFDVVPAAAGAIAVGGHALVIAHAFEGRFYGPWLLLAAAFAWAIATRRRVAIAACAVALCMIHWFGVLSLALMCLGAVAAHGRRWRDGVRLVAPAIAGPVAVLVCLPLLVRQRAAFTGTWVAPLDRGQIAGVALTYWIAAVPIAAALVLLAKRYRQPGQGLSSAEVARLRHPEILALASLALMPVVLIAISALLQPAMVARYGIVAALAWAPLVALATVTLGRAGRLVALVVLALILARNVARTRDEKARYAALVQSYDAAYDQARALHAPIVFQSIHVLYPVVAPRRGRDTLARYLELPDSAFAAMYPAENVVWLRTLYRLERDIMRSQRRLFGFPALATQAQLDATPRFVLVATDASLPRGYKTVEAFGPLVFPHHRMTRLSESLTLFERSTGFRTAR